MRVARSQPSATGSLSIARHTGRPLGQVIEGEVAEKAFISLFGVILRLRNILAEFDDFQEGDTMARAMNKTTAASTRISIINIVSRMSSPR